MDKTEYWHYYFAKDTCTCIKALHKTELNDLRKIIWLENDLRITYVSSEEFQFIKSSKIWWGMADLPCLQTSAMLHQIFNDHTGCHASTPVTS